MISVVGQAAVVYMDVWDDNGVRSTLAFWEWRGKRYRKDREAQAKRAVATGMFINVQTGEVLVERPQYEPLYAEAV